MNSKKDKAERLVRVARMYYEEERTQGEIAEKMGVSRPLVSRMLHEARRRGIVEIRVHAPDNESDGLMTQLHNQFNIQGGHLIPEEINSQMMNQTLARNVIRCIERLQPHSLGVGWGTVIGDMISLMEKMSPITSEVQAVCPLIGNAGHLMRQYHTDESVRIMARGLSAAPQFLFSPAFAESREELELLQGTARYQTVCAQWDSLDMAIISIADCPTISEVDPTEQKLNGLCQEIAVGRFVAHYFDKQGNVLRSDSDYSLHISPEQLAHCRYVLGICSAETSVQALSGALRTGLFTHIFARESAVRTILADAVRYENGR